MISSRHKGSRWEEEADGEAFSGTVRGVLDSSLCLALCYFLLQAHRSAPSHTPRLNEQHFAFSVKPFPLSRGEFPTGASVPAHRNLDVDDYYHGFLKNPHRRCGMRRRKMRTTPPPFLLQDTGPPSMVSTNSKSSLPAKPMHEENSPRPSQFQRAECFVRF